jgi:hypothetical protein
MLTLVPRLSTNGFCGEKFMSDHDHAHLSVHKGTGRSALRYIPYFSIVLILYIIGRSLNVSAQAALFAGTDYALTWSEILLVLSAVLALAEQLKVSDPGVDNTLEALSQVFMAVVQLVLFILGVAAVNGFHWFSNSGFLMQTFISLSASIVAVLINARTLRRTMTLGGDS